jgi:nucleoside-diphosphate-sugar epimerase
MPSGNLVAVIGGRGFIGRCLVAKLIEGGAEVRVISRQAGDRGSRATEIRADVAHAGEIRAALAGASEVYYLATGGGDRWSDFERDIVQGAKNVAEACLEHGARRLYYASSIAALYLGGKGRVEESCGTDPKPLSRAHYSRAKATAEKALLELHRTRGLPVVLFRPGVVMGPLGPLTHSGIGYWPSDIWCLGWGRGRHPLPFVLVEDVAEALHLAARAPGIEGQAFNLVGDVRPNAEEFVQILAERSMRRYRFYPQSLWKLQAFEIGKWLIKKAARKPENPFPSFRDLKSRSLRAPIDCSAAKSILGWKPCSDREFFLRSSIDSNLHPAAPGDLRLR